MTRETKHGSNPKDEVRNKRREEGGNIKGRADEGKELFNGINADIIITKRSVEGGGRAHRASAEHQPLWHSALESRRL